MGVVIMDHSASLWNNRMLDTWKIYQRRTPLVYEPRGTVSNPKENCIVVDDIVEEDQPEIEQVSCGSTHALVLVKGGDAYSWGFG